MKRSTPSIDRAGGRGFSLLELMIAITILGIVTAAAVASYGSSMIKTRRGSAEACLTETAQFMERHYVLNMTYEDADLPELACIDDLADFYTFAFDGVPDADSFVVQATPIDSQLDDTQCGTLSINQVGTKGANDVLACW